MAPANLRSSEKKRRIMKQAETIVITPPLVVLQHPQTTTATAPTDQQLLTSPHRLLWACCAWSPSCKGSLLGAHRAQLHQSKARNTIAQRKQTPETEGGAISQERWQAGRRSPLKELGGLIPLLWEGIQVLQVRQHAVRPSAVDAALPLYRATQGNSGGTHQQAHSPVGAGPCAHSRRCRRRQRGGIQRRSVVAAQRRVRPCPHNAARGSRARKASAHPASAVVSSDFGTLPCTYLPPLPSHFAPGGQSRRPPHTTFQP